MPINEECCKQFPGSPCCDPCAYPANLDKLYRNVLELKTHVELRDDVIDAYEAQITHKESSTDGQSTD